MPLNIIIINGPRDIIEIYWWYLDPILMHISNEKYIIDIIDQFSKWLWSSDLKDKSAKSVLFYIKKYINAFEPINKIKTDNSTEFKNVLISEYLTNKKIKNIFTPVQHPQSNGCVEKVHQQVKCIINQKYILHNMIDDFDINQAILEANEYHNKVNYEIGTLHHAI